MSLEKGSRVGRQETGRSWNGRREGPRQGAEGSGMKFTRGSQSQHAEAREAATDKGTDRGQAGARRASVTPGKEDAAGEPTTQGAVTAAGPGTRTRQAAPSSEAPFHRPHGAQVPAPHCRPGGSDRGAEGPASVLRSFPKELGVGG